MNKLLTATVLAATLCSGNAFANAYTYKIYMPGIIAASAAAPSVTYATLNPNDRNANVTLSNSNLTTSSYGGAAVRANMGKSSGKWYWEVTLNSLCTGGTYPPVAGIASTSTPLTSPWNSTSNYSFYATNISGHGVLFASGGSSSYGSPGSAGEVVGIALDLGAMTMTVYENGVSQGTAFTSISAGTWYPYVADPNAGPSSAFACSATANFGQNVFKYSPPAGYNAGWYQ